MEQRTLRLGDIVDDYCPRERRITNHAIVAIIENAIRQTRCATCEAEHVYKGAREPKRRRKDDAPALFDQVLADVTGAQLVSSRASSDMAHADDDAAEPDAPSHTPVAGSVPPPAGTAPVSAPVPMVARSSSPEGEGVRGVTATDAQAVGSLNTEHGADAHVDGWLAHRQLIRATLPRIEGEQPAPRPIPEFTMYQRQPAGRFRSQWHGGGNGHGHARGNGNGNANGNVNGNVPGANGYRAGGFRPERPGNGQPAPNGGGRPNGVPGGRPGRRHRGKKRPPR